MSEETMSLHEALRVALSEVYGTLDTFELMDPEEQKTMWINPPQALREAARIIDIHMRTADEREAPVMKVFVRDQYGVQVYHPANEAARLFAAIAGTKTITPANLSHILKLGYSIEYVHPTPTHPIQQPIPR